MDQDLFMFVEDGRSRPQHSIVTVEGAEAERLKQDGKATEIDNSVFNKARQQVQRAHRRFREKQQEIKHNDDPRANEEVKRYDVDKARQTFEQEAQQAQEDYASWRQEQIKQAQTKAAQSAVRVSDGDRQTAEQAANWLQLQVASATNATDLQKALSDAEQQLSLMTEAQKTAMQGQIEQVVEKAQQKDDQLGATGVGQHTHALVSQAQDVRQMDQLAVKAAEALPYNVDLELMQMQVAEGA